MSEQLPAVFDDLRDTARNWAELVASVDESPQGLIDLLDRIEALGVDEARYMLLYLALLESHA